MRECYAHLIRKVFSHLVRRGRRRLITFFTSAPLGHFGFLLGRFLIFDGRCLLFRRRYSCDLGVRREDRRGRLAVGSSLVVRSRGWRLDGIGIMLSQSLLDSDSLELGFPLGFLKLDVFVCSKVLQVLGMVIGLVSLGLWCRMIFLCSRFSVSSYLKISANFEPS